MNHAGQPLRFSLQIQAEGIEYLSLLDLFGNYLAYFIHWHTRTIALSTTLASLFGGKIMVAITSFI
jgi:hypothetical protein